PLSKFSASIVPGNKTCVPANGVDPALVTIAASTANCGPFEDATVAIVCDRCPCRMEGTPAVCACENGMLKAITSTHAIHLICPVMTFHLLFLRAPLET